MFCEIKAKKRKKKKLVTWVNSRSYDAIAANEK